MSNPIRYAILDHAGDDVNLWELPWPLSMGIDGELVEIHPRRTVEDVRPCLIELLREGHVEMYRSDDPDGPKLSLEEALAAVADDNNWDPPTAHEVYCVVNTESGEREYKLEHEASRR